MDGEYPLSVAIRGRQPLGARDLEAVRSKTPRVIHSLMLPRVSTR